MKSLFVTGTDTDVGKTYVAAGIAVVLRKMGIDVGVMKPFAAGTPKKKGLKSRDVQILTGAAKTDDPESLTNPQLFPIPASPYTAYKTLGVKPKISTVLTSLQRLAKVHELMLVEGMGGIMTPILKDYFVADLIYDMKIPAVIVTRTRIGTINHTIMTVKMCQKYKIPIHGIILNDFDSDGYNTKDLSRDLKGLLDIPILGVIPRIHDTKNSTLYEAFKNNLDFKTLLK